MERVEELRHELREALKSFRQIQEQKQLFIQDKHKTTLSILLGYVADSFRTNAQEYFEQRNEDLHIALQSIDESLNHASDAHTSFTNYRSQLIQTCNSGVQPPATPADTPILVNGVGVEDLQKVSAETESCIQEVNVLQENYNSIMSNIEEKIPEKVGSLLNETEVRLAESEEARFREAMSVTLRSEEELDKAVQVLDSMEKMKQQMESLFHILRQPKSTN